jgi:hypothetical protein
MGTSITPCAARESYCFNAAGQYVIFRMGDKQKKGGAGTRAALSDGDRTDFRPPDG